MAMRHEDLERQIAGVASLDEPVRRDLYLYIAGQQAAVSRDEAAAALGISRPLAAFHLDKLASEGLLSVEYRRLTGRTGPGAGRPSKLYRRSGRQLEISLPARSYELAARQLAEAVERAGSAEAITALGEAAHALGETLGEAAHVAPTAEVAPEAQAEAALEACGYEPVVSEDGIRLRNCPFHALAASHRGLVCGMNLSLLEGFAEGMGAPLEAVLDPQPGMCCVRLRPTRNNEDRTL